MRFALVNLGCKVNRVEADTIGSKLLAAGWEHAREDADVAIVNTCTVTAEADRKTRKEVRRALDRNGHATVMVIGCAAALDAAFYEGLSPRVRVVGKGDVVKECLALAGQREDRGAPSTLRVGEKFPTRVGIKVQDGCDNACTFCIVHVARGSATSMPLAQCIDEAASHARAGVREIVLAGIDLGAYNSDGAGLADLVMALRAAAPETRLRISSIEPVTIDERIVEVLATQDGMVCRHLHVPLQSGSSKVLRDMARNYDAQAYLDIIAGLRKAVPEISLSTDVIVGFPGETDEDFASTLEVAQACGFSRMHVFRYSRRAGTPAAQRPDQIGAEVSNSRSEVLRALADRLRRQDALARVGTSECILVESSERGMTESYHPVHLNGGFERGQLVECTLAALREDGALSV